MEIRGEYGNQEVNMEIRGEYGKDQRSRHQGDRVMLDRLPREKGYGGYQT